MDVGFFIYKFSYFWCENLKKMKFYEKKLKI